MSPRFGALTHAAALARLQHLLGDVAWSAAQEDEQPGGHAEALRLDRLADRLQEVIDVYTEGHERVTLDQEGATAALYIHPTRLPEGLLEEDDTARWWQHWQEEEAARIAQEKRWAGEA
jgi:hypothetical protein